MDRIFLAIIYAGIVVLVLALGMAGNSVKPEGVSPERTIALRGAPR